MLEVDVFHRLGQFVLEARFASDGRVTALFGPSGAGKTSLVQALAGLLRPERGRIVVDEQVLFDHGAGIHVPPHRRRIGYVFQEGRLFPHLTVRQNLLYGRWFTPRAERREGLDRVVDLLGHGFLLDRRPGRLSGGEKQRVALGRALLASPRLFLMDEPLASLDAARKEETRAARTRTVPDPTAPGTRAADTRLPPSPPPQAGEDKSIYPPPLAGEGREGGSPATYSVAASSYDRPATLPAPSSAPTATSGTVTQGQPATESVIAGTAAPTRGISAPTVPLATDPIKPIQVKTVKVKMAPAQIAALAPAPPAPSPAQVAVHDASRDGVPRAAATPQAAPAEGPKREPERDLIAEAIRATTPPESAPRRAAPPVPSVHYSGWIIPVGAFDVEREARDRLNAIQAKVGQKLKHANPFTEAVVTGDKTLYRARFAGIQKDEAEAICRQLKRNDIACMTIKN